MKNRKLIDSFNNAANGLIYAIKNERNIKIHIVAAVFVLILGLTLDLTRMEFLMVCLVIGFVLVCELFNTAMEIFVDVMISIYHPKVKIIKDVAAGAVLLSAITSVVAGYFIFYPKISTILQVGLQKAPVLPINLTVIALLLTIIGVLVLKARAGKGAPFSGGMPSGHSAIAFAITTSVALWVKDVNITLLCLFLSALVLQSRLEGEIHNLPELLAGAALGILVTLLVFQIFYR